MTRNRTDALNVTHGKVVLRWREALVTGKLVEGYARRNGLGHAQARHVAHAQIVLCLNVPSAGSQSAYTHTHTHHSTAPVQSKHVKLRE